MRLLVRRLLVLLLAIMVISAAVGLWRTYRKARESSQLRHEAEVQLADLNEREAKLRDDLARLESDRGKEEALRERYGLGKSGEHMIVIVDESGPAPATTTQSTFSKLLHRALPWW